jgi:hypothetical protein
MEEERGASYRWPSGPPGTARPKSGRAWAEACRAGTARPTHRASPKAQKPIVLAHRKSLFLVAQLCGLFLNGWKISLFCIPLVLSLALYDYISLFCIPLFFLFDHVVPGRPTVPRVQPRHYLAVGLGRHGHDLSRAVPCLARPKLRASVRAMGLRPSIGLAGWFLCLWRPHTWVPHFFILFYFFWSAT